SGGAERRLVSNPEFRQTGWMVWSPTGTHLLVSGRPKDTKPDMTDWWALPIDGGAPVKTGALPALSKLTEDPTRPELLLHEWTGSYVYFVVAGRNNSSNIWRTAISPRTFRLSGEPQQLTQGAAQNNNVRAGGGKMVFTAHVTNVQAWQAPIDAISAKMGGAPQPLTSATCAHGPGFFSADGTQYVNCCEG